MESTHRITAALREVGADLAALVWPTQCPGCGRPDRQCCDTCLDALVRAALAAGRPAIAGEVRAPPRGMPVETVHAPPVFSAGPHEGVLRDLLIPFKHAGRTSLVPALGAVLAVPLARALALARGPAPPLIVSVPSRPERVRERGFHHVEMLGRAALRALPAQTGCAPGEARMMRVLRTLPGRTSQVGLRASGRRENAAKIAVLPRMRARVDGREVILLDDVRTTGQTLDAATAVLALSGARIVAVVTLAQAVRHAPTK